uniref:Microcephalin n=1 Tax=Ursus americanus TaxID=9643 RepID=A0A452RU46_URSAM
DDASVFEDVRASVVGISGERKLRGRNVLLLGFGRGLNFMHTSLFILSMPSQCQTCTWGCLLAEFLWMRCRTAGAHIDEALFPAANTREHLPSLIKKKRKCMQPKDFIPKTPEHDKRLKRKLRKWLQSYKDNDVPVLLFESNGSLMYSPTIKTCAGQHSTMQRRLQEMKEKRENLSPTSSLEKSHDNPANSPGEAWNISHDTLCSDESFAGDLHSSFDNLCGNVRCGSQEGKLGGIVDEIKSDVCVSSPVLKTRSPGYLSPLTPQKPMDSLSKEETGRWGDAVGVVVTLDKQQSEGETRMMSDEKHSLSPLLSATKRCPSGHSRSESSSARKKRTSERVNAPPKERLKKKRCGGKPAGPKGQLWKLGRRLQLLARPAVEAPGCGVSSYDDYFSPDNLRERSSEALLPGLEPSAGLAQFSCRGGLSQRERRNIMQMADFSCIGKNRRLVNMTDVTAKTSSSLQKPTQDTADAVWGCLTSEGVCAAEGTPGHCQQAGEGLGGDFPRLGGDFPPLERSSVEMTGLLDVRSVQKEDSTSGTWKSSGAEMQRDYELDFVGDRTVDKAAEEREHSASRHDGSM